MYVFSLLLIMGLPSFVKYAMTTVVFKVKKKIVEKISFVKSPSILDYAASRGIEVFDIQTPNSQSFREKLRALKPDVIINQSQSIKKRIARNTIYRVINRHNALLPKNRGINSFLGFV